MRSLLSSFLRADSFCEPGSLDWNRDSGAAGVVRDQGQGVDEATGLGGSEADPDQSVFGRVRVRGPRRLRP